jgi:hypothetical protein
MCTLVVASLHFILSVYVAFRTQHVFYLNPIRITALNDLWPTYANSDMATLIGWLLLTALYLSVLVTYIRKYDPELIGRIRNSIEYNRETRRVTYETRNAKEIELIPITKLLVQFYKLKSRFGESEII